MNMLFFFVKKIKHNFGNFFRYFYITYLRACGVQIGKNCMISLGAKIDVTRGSIIIGNNCTITHGVVILSHDHAASKMNKKISQAITIIDNDSFIGVNSVVLPGKRIGKGSIIGAGSIVTSNIPDYSIAFGNPSIVFSEYVPKHKKLKF